MKSSGISVFTPTVTGGHGWVTEWTLATTGRSYLRSVDGPVAFRIVRSTPALAVQDFLARHLRGDYTDVARRQAGRTDQ